MSSLKPLPANRLTCLLSAAYATGVRLRNNWYNVHPPAPVNAPVVSVGGISAGGTGKTPLTSLLIRKTLDCGATPILLSRGYGRRKKTPLLLSPQSRASAEDIGDEPAMLRRRHSGLWAGICADRSAMVQRALARHITTPVFIMDDGFQHRRLHRDLDIVTLPPEIFSEELIPCGRLREPLSALSRADMIVIADNEEYSSRGRRVCRELQNKYPRIPVLHLTSRSGPWVCPDTGECKNILTDRTTLFSGIARPERFLASAQKRCLKIEDHIVFSDHQHFSDNEYSLLRSKCADQLGTTEKDFIRLNRKKMDNIKKMWYLKNDIACDTEDSEILTNKLERLIRGK
ncbi:MAG: tetraacyldisaccharide 4'-kinase [Fibrobacterota bacterium]